ncbi:MAG: hypothetical protein F4Y07_15450 [Gemmatimonadetes bacterium]|nr:hypothetical protein [Gemmatimonadota bacterium]MYE17866.1 hypothetical protein [Gemmatimonadota bacterium]MYG22876.1 hypothetical protein [Gemmatimonadota bacterium]MYJ37790.1 hypothetical protein [Gemmatimonadota bacterium]
MTALDLSESFSLIWPAANRLGGVIPPELANLTNLETLSIGGNLNISGPIPPEIGDLVKLKDLNLGGNSLTGRVPRELGELVALRGLYLHRNRGLEGPLPTELTALGELDVLLASDTNLCAPLDAAFQAWLLGITRVEIEFCPASDHR